MLQTAGLEQLQGGQGRPGGAARPWVPGRTERCGCGGAGGWQPLAGEARQGPEAGQQCGGQEGPLGHSGAGGPGSPHSSGTIKESQYLKGNNITGRKVISVITTENYYMQRNYK